MLVILDERAYPLSRLWCLFGIGSTPIDKLTLITHGLDPSQLARAYNYIDTNKADCWAQSDKVMILGKVEDMLVEQKVIDQEATIEQAMNHQSAQAAFLAEAHQLPGGYVCFIG